MKCVIKKLLFVFIFIFGITLISTASNAAIQENKTNVRFTQDKSNESRESDEYIIRFKEFRKFKQTSQDKHILNFEPYTIEGDKQYLSLLPFIEWLQFTDFEVSPNRDFAIVYSAACQRKIASAETPWTCQLNATLLNHEGYVKGDMKGDFVKVRFHKTQPYFFLIRATAGDLPVYAELYDLKASKIRNINAFEESMLNDPIKGNNNGYK